MTTPTSWHARPDILRETSSELLCSTELRKVDEGKTATGTMSTETREITLHRTLLLRNATEALLLLLYGS